MEFCCLCLVMLHFLYIGVRLFHALYIYDVYENADRFFMYMFVFL